MKVITFGTAARATVRPHHRLWAGALVAIAIWLVLPARQALAQPALSAEIVSWQVVGLDSNDPAGSAPELFMVQAAVTNNGTEVATGVTATLTLGTLIPNPCAPADCISLVSSPDDSLGSIAPGEQVDAFWTVRVAKTAAAFGTSTPISITVSATNAPSVIASQAGRAPPPCGSSATPGNTLLVEKLISQSRNDVTSYSVSPGVQLPDGSWEVVLGMSFTVTVIADTATAYDEISVPATVDPSGAITPDAVSFSYGLGTPTDDDIYTLNAGGQVTATYTYNASALGMVRLSQLIYDCSGNSFHYNSDYLSDSVTIRVVAGPPAITLAKSSSPSGQVDPGERITFTISYLNSGGSATGFIITDVVDPILNDVTVADGGSFDPATRTITWQIGSLLGGASGSVSFSAIVDDHAGGKTITNFATGDSDQTPLFSSPPVTISTRPTTPVTGLPVEALGILGWAMIGFGDTLSSRRLEKFRHAQSPD